MKKIEKFIIAILAIFVFGYFLKEIALKKDIEIAEYNNSRDRDFFINRFKRDWYWLVENPNFSIEYILDNKKPSKMFYDADKKELIYTLLKNGYPIGFITFNMRNFYEGFIHLLAIEEGERGKGYAKELVKFALKKLKELGAKKITILTRIHNPAQKIYKELGFREYHKDEGFVYLDYKV